MVKKIMLSVFAAFLVVYVAAQDIYVAGYEWNNNSRSVAKVWKNGTLLYTLTNGNYDAQANAIAISGNDVYVAGYESNNNSSSSKNIAKVWKNDKLLYTLTDGSSSAKALGIAVSGNDVYVTGYDRGGAGARVWKNGALLYAPTGSDGSWGNWATSIAISNNNVYVTVDSWTYSGTVTKVWKNGTPLFTLTNGDCEAQTNSITISGNDIYVAGYENIGGNGSVTAAKVWKNGTLLHTLSSSRASAKSIAVSGGNVYTAGYTGMDNGSKRCYSQVWKNDFYLYDLTNNSASANSIAVAGNDVYVAGYETINFQRCARVWKNGTLLYALTDGRHSASALSICMPSIAVTNIDLDVVSRSMYARETFQLFAVVMPPNATNRNVLWRSSNENVASVSVSGLITALSAGTTTITATTEDGGFQATCRVTVQQGTGIVDIFENEIVIYPNPVNDKLKIAGYKFIEENEIAIITDVSSKVVLTCELQITEDVALINVSGLPQGVYFVKIGKFTGKFVKN